MRKRIDITIIVPLLLMIIIIAFFIIVTNGRLFSIGNLKTIFDQTIIVIIVGLGVIFVVAQGGTDLSVGTTIGLTTVFGSMIARTIGNEWVIFPIAIVIALIQGVLNGLLVAKLRVPSFMVTIAMLIGIRGLVNYFVAKQAHLYLAGPLMQSFGSYYLKLPVLIVLVILAYYLLTHTKFGEYCKAIGENEAVAVSVGIPVAKIKIIAFVLSSLMAAIGGFFTMAKVGGTNTTMGSGVEIDVVMAIFLGSVLVTGGYSAKVPKLIIGAFTLSIVKNGMFMAGLTSIRDTQTVRGLLLLIILFVTIQISRRQFSLSHKSHKDLPQETTPTKE